MIKIIRDILDFVLFVVSDKNVIYEVFIIFMCEVWSIVNVRFIVVIIFDLINLFLFSLLKFFIKRISVDI